MTVPSRPLAHRSIRSLLPAAFLSALFSVLVVAGSAAAQFDPQNGTWGKDDPDHYRVMTWNVLDHVATDETKVEQRNAWTAIARVIAAMRPDVLVLQEAGDASGGVDTVGELRNVVELLFHGGTDPYRGGEVTAYVQKYAPEYDLPYIFVSTYTDGFNRNVIVSRYRFRDLNGDAVAMKSDIDVILPGGYAPGGTGGIRGFQFAEIDLPDERYPGDAVVGNAHLKAGSSGDDLSQRLVASQNVAYWIDHLLNGAGSGMPDPDGRVRDNPPVTTILDDRTPVLIAGDWNEDESTNGRRGPAEWLAAAEFAGGSDGTDRDRSDATFDDAREPFSNDPDTRGASKLDYIAWQDSIAVLQHSWILNTQEIPLSKMPPELEGFFGGPLPITNIASDHLPVLADFGLPRPDVTAALAPQADAAPVDGELFFDASVTSNIDESWSGQAWIDVFRPDGTPLFASNPKFGPKSFGMSAGQVRRKFDIRLRIPGSATPGPGYRVVASVGTFPSSVIHTTEFVFEVTP